MIVVRDRSGETAVLGLAGPLVAPLENTVRREIAALVAAGRRRIRLDLARVTDLDAAGIGMLADAYNIATAARAVLQVTHTVGRIRELLERVRLLAVLTAGSMPVDRSDDAEIERRNDAA